MADGTRLLEELVARQDIPYRDFQRRLIPNLDPECILGVRTPELRRLAKQMRNDGSAAAFLETLPHRYFEETQVHAFLIADIKDYDVCLAEVCRFLPFVDNWATCDQLSPKVFGKHREELLEVIPGWLRSEETYTVRFGIKMLMTHYLDEAFDPVYLDWVAGMTTEEYYVNMMIAWYFATALAKQYEATLPVLEERRLEPWTHNKTIQKAVESYRISPEQKEYLRTLKVGKEKEG